MIPISDTVQRRHLHWMTWLLFGLFVRRDRWRFADPGHRPVRRRWGTG